MHLTPHHISETKSESFREHPLALETVVYLHFLIQHNHHTAQHTHISETKKQFEGKTQNK